MPPAATDLEKLYENQLNSREKAAKGYKKKYGYLLESIQKSPLASIREITWNDEYALGKQLDAFCNFVSMCEEDGTVAQLGKLPLMALDLLSFTYGVSPINAIASVQPIDDVQGMVMYRDLVAQNSRGNINAGDTVFSTLGAPTGFPKGYATDTVFAEPFLSVPSGAVASWTNIQLGGSASNMNPIYNQRCVIRLSFTVDRTPDVAMSFAMAVDESTGNFSMVQNPGTGAVVYVAGHVDFATGIITTLDISETPTAAAIAGSADYVTLPEAMVDIQKMTMRLQQKPVWAQLFTLKGTLGTGEAYQLKKRYGVNAEQMMAEDLTAAINIEIMNTAVGIITANLPALVLNDTTGATLWKRQPQQGVDYNAHKQTFLDTLADSNSLLQETAGRGNVNCHMAGNRAAAILSTLPGWTPLFNDDSYGPHIYGKINGVPVVRIPQDTILDKWTVISIHKGKTPFDAPLVYAPYMPLVLTQLVPQAYNVFQNQQGAAVWAALSPLVSNLSTRCRIDNTGFNFAASPNA